jgi:hypothetical protein
MRRSDLTQLEYDTVKMERDPSNGGIRVMFKDQTELDKLNSWLKTELDRTYDDWREIWAESVENDRTYRCKRIRIPDSKSEMSVYPAPIARIPADQRTFSICNAVLKADPIFSIDAYLNAQYTSPVPQLGAASTPSAAPAQMQVEDSEQVAHRLEQGYKFVVRERIRLPQKLHRGLKNAMRGSPNWWKVCWDAQPTVTMNDRKLDGAVIDLSDAYESERVRGDGVKWYLIPFSNCMMPLDYLNDECGVDISPWFWERTMWSDELLKLKYEARELFLVPDEAAYTALCKSKVDRTSEYQSRIESGQGRNPQKPEQVCDTGLIWFYRLVKYIDPDQPETDQGTKNWKIKRLNLLGDYHRSVGKLMTLWLNPNDHQCRPYELVDELDDVGDCTVGRMRYHQQTFTFAAQSELKSGHTANTLLYWYDKNVSDVAEFFGRTPVIEAGDHIPGRKDEEWGTAAAGDKTFSMAELMKMILSMSQLDSRENEFTLGGRPPGRTSPNTVSQVYEHAEESKTALLQRLSLKLSRLLRLDMETRRQYQPLGEVLPLWTDAGKSATEVAFTFPVGDVLDNMRIALTAADEALAQEHDPQQIMMRKQALMQDGQFIAQILAPLADINNPLPPELAQVYRKIAVSVERMNRKLIAQTESDEEQFDLTPEINAFFDARNALIQQQQAIQQAQQQMAQSQPQQQQQPGGGVTQQGDSNVPPQGSAPSGQPGAAPTPPSTGRGAGPPAQAGAEPPPPSPAPVTPQEGAGAGPQTVQ